MLDNLYENIGGKIKNWAKWIFIIEAIGAIITGLVLLFTDEDLILYGLLTAICGPIVAYVSSWVLYAFGELVEDVHAMRDKEGTTKVANAKREEALRLKRESEEMARREAEPKSKQEVKEKPVVPIQIRKGKYECPRCGCSIKKGQEKCICFSELDWSQII